jgi:hypothetical protein
VSKNRTAETVLRTGSVREGTFAADPSTHPRTSLPWNGTCTSEPTPAPGSLSS